MNTVPLANDRPEASLFCDGIGDRVVSEDAATGELLQILRIRPALTAVPSFEFALRERSARLANFRHAYYARVRRIDRIQVPSPGLAVVSDHVEGTRLSDILRVAHERRLQLDINAALCLVRQLVPAVAVLHENAREVAHGLIAPERLIVTPHARLVIVEHVLAAAIEQLQYSRERLWQEFRIAMPPAAPHFDHRADVTGIGLVALALVLGRPLKVEEFPNQLPALLNEVRERTSMGEEQPLSTSLRDWLVRALQLDPRRSFASAPEALVALENMVAEDSAYVAAPVALEILLSRYVSALLDPLPVEATPAAPAGALREEAALPGPAEPTVLPREPSSEPDKGSAAGSEWQTPDLASIISARLAQPEDVTEPTGAAATPQTPAPEKTEPAGSSPAAATSDVPPVAPRDITEIISTEDLGLGRDEHGAPLDLFNDEAALRGKKRTFGSRRIVLAIGALAILAGGAAAWLLRPRTPVAAPTMGTLVVQSNPAGVQVVVDGVDRGLTPAKLSIAPGAHILELRGRGVPRVIPFTMTAGSEVSQYLEFAETPSTGQLHVQSQPSGARVIVDGTERGVAPVTISDLAPGAHEVVLQSAAGSARQTVTVQAGATSSLVAPVSPDQAAGPVSGWLSVRVPITVEIFEGGRLLGTSDADRVMMSAGRHELELVNELVGYRERRVVQITPGKIAALSITLPTGTVNLNASPWAEVWIDGQRVGETPIGNLNVALGPHEVIFRHPQLGEKRHAISVTLSAPVRLSVDMR